MRKLIPALLLSFGLCLTLTLLIVGSTSAQEPDTSPAKGSDPLPIIPSTEPAAPKLALDPTLLVKIEPQLLKKLLQSGQEPVPFVVYLKATTNLAAIAPITPSLGAQKVADPLVRRTAIVNALQQTARDSQAGVLQTLNSPPRTANSSAQVTAASEIHPLWIINAVAAKGSLDLVLALAARPDVQVVRLDKEIKLEGSREMEKWRNGGMEEWRNGGNISPFHLSILPLFQPPNLPTLQPSNSPALQPSSPPTFQSSILPALQPSSPPTLQPSNLPPLQSSPQWGITKIRADLVQNALGIDGTGIVVANIDSGVDWLHPALQTRYRGYNGSGKLPQHLGNWFDATGEGTAYPIDSTGHGSHTMGTMVGGNGIGVAPGARWIAARAFNSSGSAQSSWLHNAFQWMLAPNGNPALAPDVVNNSWGNSIGANIEFQPDIQALLSAGIYPVFSAGNTGPDEGTVGSPGSLDIAFAVGATDINDEIANFSGRGPSPWGKIKPEVTAPGKDVISAFPGGAYMSLDGTSMAAPHVAGVAALMLQASPALSNNLSSISTALMSTAVPLGSPIPNNDSGWGRIDAYNAVMAVGSFGTLQGLVSRAGVGTPIGGAALQITPHGGGPAINTSTGSNGAYLQGLAPNTYDVTVSAFGYEPVTAFGLDIINHQATTQNFSLTPKPTGTLTGIVTEAGTGVPLVATITIEGTPAQTTSQPGGSYNLTLPEGIYTARVVAPAHRISRVTNITINDGGTTNQNFSLNPAPKILLVDSGRWYQASEIGYYQRALDDLLYPYDTWAITKPFETPNDVPITSTLTAYDVVIWSSPFDSPGYVAADAAVRDFMSQGGKFFLSGQDVAFFDGGGSIFSPFDYFRNFLKAELILDDSEVYTVTGAADGPFAGLTLTIAGGDGADNQASPDTINNLNSDFAGTLLNYGNEAGRAGLHVGLCLPYRAIFLPFGYEAISSQADRSQVMDRTLNWLAQAPPLAGVQVSPPEQTLIGNFGTVVSHTVRIRNIGASAATFNLSLSGGTPNNWPVSPVPPPTLSLTACQSQTITMGVQINVNNSWHISDTRTLLVQLVGNPAISGTVTRTTKTPAPVLLVDDDRFYSFAAEFKNALDANQVPYDYWQVPKAWQGAVPPSPPLQTLQMYPMVVWYTAYDWFQPLTTDEENRLASYLNGGGRLFFSGQDYIYNLPNHQPSPFAQNYLGILDHIEDYSSTVMIGQRGNPVSAGLGPYPLTFPLGYANWTDALTPTAAARIASVGQAGQANGLIHWGVGSGGQTWHTNFLAFGPELLAPADRIRLMQRSVGWLSWLGSSAVTPNLSTSLDGSDLTYTAILTNDGWTNLATVAFTATFPAELTPGTASPELTPSGGNLVWSGPLAKNERKVFTYTASLAGSLPLGTTVNQVSWIAYPEHNILFDRLAQVRVNFPELGNSSISVTPASNVGDNDVLTYTIVLRNDGLVDDPLVTTTNTLPHMLELLGLGAPSQGTVISSGKSFTWTTSLAKNSVATLTYRALISYETSSAIQNTATINDDLSDPLNLTAQTIFKSRNIYFPFIYKN